MLGTPGGLGAAHHPIFTLTFPPDKQKQMFLPKLLPQPQLFTAFEKKVAMQHSELISLWLTDGNYFLETVEEKNLASVKLDHLFGHVVLWGWSLCSLLVELQTWWQGRTR